MLSIAAFPVAAVTLAVIGCAALQDVRERLIANRYSLLIMAFAPLHHATMAESLSEWLVIGGSALGVATALFVAGFILWRLGGLGGGDVKLLCAAVFFVGADGAAGLLVATVIAGGVLALVYVIVPRTLPAASALLAGPDGASAPGPGSSIPYGVAIALGLAAAIVPTLPPVIG